MDLCKGRRPGGGPLSDVGANYPAELLKLAVYGSLGFFLKWGLALLSSRAADVRQSLKMLDGMSRNAEAVGYTIMAAAPDIGMSAGVMADRTNLGNALRRSLGGRSNFDRVENCLALYGRSLKCADPNFGQIGAIDIEQMRAAEQALRLAITHCARPMLAWRLFRHERVS